MKSRSQSVSGNAAAANLKSRSARRRANARLKKFSFGLKGLNAPTPFGNISLGSAEFDSSNRMNLKGPRGMVGLGTRAIDIQRTMPRLSSTFRNGVQYDIIEGTDFITTVSSGSSGNVSGDILKQFDISPTSFTTTRLYQFALLYQRYRFSRIRFVYEPIANATQSGQVIGYADFDPDNDLLVDSETNVSIAAAHQGQRITQIWDPVVFDMEQAGTFTDLFTEVGSDSSNDPRLSIQGIFYLIAASVLSSNIPLGNIYIDYQVWFSIPFLNSLTTSSDLSWAASFYGSGGSFSSGALVPGAVEQLTQIAGSPNITVSSGVWTISSVLEGQYLLLSVLINWTAGATDNVIGGELVVTLGGTGTATSSLEYLNSADAQSGSSGGALAYCALFQVETAGTLTFTFNEADGGIQNVAMNYIVDATLYQLPTLTRRRRNGNVNILSSSDQSYLKGMIMRAKEESQKRTLRCSSAEMRPSRPTLVGLKDLVTAADRHTARSQRNSFSDETSVNLRLNSRQIGNH